MKKSTEQPQKIAEGQWGTDVSWEFYLSDTLPDPQLCTAVFCLAIVNEAPDQIVLARSKRGWELLGGHIEPGEDIEAALVREALEEGGFYPSRYAPFGYRKITSEQPIPNDHHGGFYPTVSYIPHFVATTDRPLVPLTGDDIFESAIFAVDAMPLDDIPKQLVLAGLSAYKIHAQHLASISS